MARVLVADDEPAIRDILRSIAELGGHEVLACAEVAETVAAFATFRPDLLILDMRMSPAGGARTILELLDASGGTGDAAVILITGGYVEDETRGLVGQPRVRAALGKPFQIQAMREAIQSALDLPPPPPSQHGPSDEA
jgi:CheY-like chemotaxis protein